MTTQNKNILVIYGGVSPEHEVSVITAIQAMNALVEAGFTVTPFYISKKGEWYKGDKSFLNANIYSNLDKVKRSGKLSVLPANRDLRVLSKNWLSFSADETDIDVVFPIFHGQNGEDGTIQGLLELANLPYVGSGVLAGSAGMDKFVTKRIAESVGVDVTKDFLLTKGTFNKKEAVSLAKKIGFPLYVKPANLGSSIGITRVTTPAKFLEAVEVAFCYDDRVLVEEAIDLDKEINISVMGNNPYICSVAEQPIASSHTLSFEDKYVSNAKKTKGMASAKRLIPAPITDKELNTIQSWAKTIFSAINGKGLTRVDFMIDKKGKIYFNEINTIPGSLAFFLWDKSGYPFPKLVNHLVNLAIESWELKQNKISSFDSNILSDIASLGLKGKA